MSMNVAGHKRCSKCGEWKPMARFSRSRRYADGLYCQCKQCVHQLYAARTVRYTQKAVTAGSKTCARCGVTKQADSFAINRSSSDGLQLWCKACRAAYHTEHRDEKAAYNKDYHEAHREEISRQRRAYYADNRETMIDRVKAYNATHKAERQAYAQSPRGRAVKRAKDSRRRAHKRAAGGNFNARDVQRQGDEQHWLCWWRGPGCLIDCHQRYEVDHVIPLARGGHNGPDNIVIACPVCNRSKGDKLPVEWAGISNTGGI